MNIQQDIRAKVGKVQKMVFVAWLVCAGSMFVDEMHLYLFIPGFVVFIGAIVYSLYFITCPKCSAKLGQTAFQSKKLKFCPECGIDFSATAP